MNPIVSVAAKIIASDIEKNGTNSQYLQLFKQGGGTIKKGKSPKYKIITTYDSKGNKIKQKIPVINAEDYSQTNGEFIAQDVILPIIGDAAHSVGNAFGVKNSLLGQALTQMTFNDNSPFARFGANPTNAAKVAGAGAAARGAIFSDVGNTIANRMYNVADAMKEKAEKQRNMQFQADVNPTGSFWDQAGRLTTKKAFGGKK